MHVIKNAIEWILHKLRREREIAPEEPRALGDGKSFRGGYLSTYRSIIEEVIGKEAMKLLEKHIRGEIIFFSEIKITIDWILDQVRSENWM